MVGDKHEGTNEARSILDGLRSDETALKVLLALIGAAVLAPISAKAAIVGAVATPLLGDAVAGVARRNHWGARKMWRMSAVLAMLWGAESAWASMLSRARKRRPITVAGHVAVSVVAAFFAIALIAGVGRAAGRVGGDNSSSAGSTQQSSQPQTTEQKQAQTIQWLTGDAPPSSEPYGGTFTVRAEATSGARVVISATGVCSEKKHAITMTSGTGTCTVVAHQAGTQRYKPVQKSASVVASRAGLPFGWTAGPPLQETFGTTFSVTPASPHAQLTAKGACTDAGTTFTMTSGTGQCNVIVDIPATPDFLVFHKVYEVAAEKAGQSITWIDQPPKQAYPKTPFSVSGTFPAGPATISVSADTCAYDSAHQTVTLTDDAACEITASNAGNADYTPGSVMVQVAPPPPVS